MHEFRVSLRKKTNSTKISFICYEMNVHPVRHILTKVPGHVNSDTNCIVHFVKTSLSLVPGKFSKNWP